MSGSGYIGAPVFLLGAALACAGLVALARALRGGASGAPAPPLVRWPRGAAAVVLAALVLGGAIVRLHGLDEKSLGHPEIYVPGIALPEGISEPPPRIDLLRTVWWHFHDEPHPPGYYFLLWPWTKIAGTSVFALRLPSALFGIGCILLVYALAAGTHGVRTGLAAAALLAFNGNHVHWSQLARMYSLTCLLGLASTWLLLALLRDPHPRRGRELAYLAVTGFGLFTEILVWPLLAFQMAWVLWRQGAPGGRPSRLLWLQGVVVMLCSPLWVHAFYRAREAPFEPPDTRFLEQYLGFGFLGADDLMSDPVRQIPEFALIALCVIAVGCVVLGVGTARDPAAPALPQPAPRAAKRLALGGSGLALGLALAAYHRHAVLIPTAALALLVPPLLDGIAAAWTRLGPPLHRGVSRAAWLARDDAPYLWLGLGPVALMLAISPIAPLQSTRTFLVFVPFLLAAIAAGLARVASTPARTIAVSAALALLLGGSVVWFRATPGTMRDYRDAGEQIAAAYRPGDLVFVRERNWADTPLFYYVPAERHTLVARDYAAAAAAHPGARIFVVQLGAQEPTPEMREAIAGRPLVSELRARRAVVHVYGGAPGSPSP